MKKYLRIILLIIFGLSAVFIIMQSKEPRANREITDSVFNVCQQKITNYSSLRAEINKQYPVGSDVSNLVFDVERTFGKPNKEEKIKDYLFITNKSEDTENSWLYHFNKECSYSSLYSVQWHITILTDLSKKITAINIQPLIQTTDFSLTQVPFNFEYFSNSKEIQKALWELTGTGTSKSEVQKIMEVSSGEYGDLSNLELEDEKKLGYKYLYRSKDFISSRILPWEFIDIVIWMFNDENKLIDLTVR